MTLLVFDMSIVPPGVPNGVGADMCAAATCGRSLTKWSSQHLCGKCNRYVCKHHTARVTHSGLMRCAVNSGCRCTSCMVMDSMLGCWIACN
jgi:hypothetical protein